MTRSVARLRDAGFRVGRKRLFPYALAIAVVCLLVIIGWAIAQAFLGSDDAVVIEVVPIGASDRLRVQVEGAVAHPGVYELPIGASVGDAVALAGGLAEGGRLDSVLSDSTLRDGELVVIPSAESPSDVPSGPVNINTADAPELEVLPGIGPVIAERIVEFREGNGSFASVDELVAVSGISERMVNEMRHMIVVESD